jgi:hypothetical protein
LQDSARRGWLTYMNIPFNDARACAGMEIWNY